MTSHWVQFDFADFSYAFLSVLLEGIPFLLLGTLLSGLIDQFLPSRIMTKILPRNVYLGIMMSGGMGMVFPMCECGIVPVIRRLLAKGLPLSNAVAYMLAAPLVNPIVGISTYAAFRGQSPLEMAMLRLFLGWVVAVIVGMAVHNLAVRFVLKPTVQSEILTAGNRVGLTSPTFFGKLGNAVRIGMRDFLDITFYFVLGVAVACFFNTAVNQALILPLALDLWLATASMMGLSILLSLCSTSDAFIAATFVAFPAVSKLAFMIIGPMFDLKLLFIYQAVFTKRFVFGLAFGLFVLVGLLCNRLAFLPL